MPLRRAASRGRTQIGREISDVFIFNPALARHRSAVRDVPSVAQEVGRTPVKQAALLRFYTRRQRGAIVFTDVQLNNYNSLGCRNGITWPPGASAQNFAQASANCRRFSNRSPRRYAASTLSATVCASAISATSAGKPVRSAAQSRKVERKPCTVKLSQPIRRSVIRRAIDDSGCRASPPGKINSL